MAVKGAAVKAKIIEQILATFEGSFVNDKEIRIPITENGEEIQIKLVATVAMTNIPHGSQLHKSPLKSGEPTLREIEKIKELVNHASV